MNRRLACAAGRSLIAALLLASACSWVDTGSGGDGDGAGAAGIGPPGTILWGQGVEREEDDKVWFLDPRTGAVGDWWLVPGYSMSVPASGNLLVVARIFQHNDSLVFAAKAFTLKPRGPVPGVLGVRGRELHQGLVCSGRAPLRHLRRGQLQVARAGRLQQLPSGSPESVVLSFMISILDRAILSGKAIPN
jgi:hypothetical protein